MSEWISFKDQFPSKKLKAVITFEMLTCIDTQKEIPFIWIEEVKHIFKHEGKIFSECGGTNITHWMPLPKPPR